jgi:hypothetical protein
VREALPAACVQRLMIDHPAIAARLVGDMGAKLALIQQMADDLADAEIEADSADAEALLGLLPRLGF